MEFRFRTIVGGGIETINDVSIIHNFMNRLREILKEKFDAVQFEGIDEIYAYLLVGGSVYNTETWGKNYTTGIYNVRYFQTKKKIKVDFCIEKTHWVSDISIEKQFYDFMNKHLHELSGLIDKKMKINKMDFAKEDFDNLIDKSVKSALSAC